MTILVIEDSADLRRALVLAFAAAGWTVRRAADLHEAGLHLAEWRPDVILTDRCGVGGDVAELVTAGGPPVVLFSGIVEPIAGVLAIVRKPAAMAALVERVAGALAVHRGECGDPVGV